MMNYALEYILHMLVNGMENHEKICMLTFVKRVSSICYRYWYSSWYASNIMLHFTLRVVSLQLVIIISYSKSLSTAAVCV